MPKTRIHINQARIKQNKKLGLNEPVITVKDYKSNRYAHRVTINGPSTVIYSPAKPLSCGATCWVETDSPVSIDGQSLEKSVDNKLIKKYKKLAKEANRYANKDWAWCVGGNECSADTAYALYQQFIKDLESENL